MLTHFNKKILGRNDVNSSYKSSYHTGLYSGKSAVRL